MTSERNNNTQNAALNLPSLRLHGGPDSFLTSEDHQQLAELLPSALIHRRWFGGKARIIDQTTIERSIPVPHDGGTSYLLLVEFRYGDGGAETYLIPVSIALGAPAQELLQRGSPSVLLRIATTQGDGVLYDAVFDRGFVLALLEVIEHTDALEGAQVSAVRTSAFEDLRRGALSLEPRVIGAEQSNSSIVFGDHLILKLFRRPEAGINPDFELGRFLTDHGFVSTPPVAGGLELRSAGCEARTIGILQGFVRNEGDAWAYTLRSLAESMDAAAANAGVALQLEIPQQPALDLAYEQVPSVLLEYAGNYLRSAALLGRRTAEMHVTLASAHGDPNFAPEPFSDDYRHSVQLGMRAHARSVFQMLRNNLDRIPPAEVSQARQLLAREQELLGLYSEIERTRFEIQRTRVHGDYHLGQVLYTGSDFVIIDFEGEPLRTLAERRIKRSPLRDVAGMMRSFDYAAHTGMSAAVVGGTEKELASHFAQCWREWVCATFLHAYLETCECVHLVPADRRNASVLLDAFLLDKAVYELGYEINNRPNWVGIPIAGITRILNERASVAWRERVA